MMMSNNTFCSSAQFLNPILDFLLFAVLFYFLLNDGIALWKAAGSIKVWFLQILQMPCHNLTICPCSSSSSQVFVKQVNNEQQLVPPRTTRSCLCSQLHAHREGVEGEETQAESTTLTNKFS